jgi:hypothetical protein
MHAMQWLRQLRELVQRPASYLVLALMLPGGSIVALILWLYRRVRSR